jgi:predicted RNase H-like nuclease
MTFVRGVDGCPAGWLAATFESRVGLVSFQIHESATELLAAQAAVTAIDIPIGLPDSEARRCDLEARRLLGPRASSVFPAPARATLAHAEYSAACDASAAACGKRLSKQAFAILPKIAEVDTALRADPEGARRVFEVHPEVCFAVWNGRQPMRHPKASGFGFAERLALVEDAFPGAAERARGQFGRSEVSDDDILDALAALWTARRIERNVAVRLPEAEIRDRAGLPMVMWA